MNLTGNTILITGGGTGIGFEIAKEFVEKGNRVIISGRRLKKLMEAKEKVPELEIIQGDVGNVKGIKKLAEVVIKNYADINVLINNAGILECRNVTRPADDLEELTNEIDINVMGPIRMNSIFMDVLKKNKGTIINVSSGLAFVPNIAMPVYCASKAAIHSYTTTLRQQLEGVVEVIEIAPPLVNTGIVDLGGGGIPVDDFVKGVFTQLEAGTELITVGMSTKLFEMSRSNPEKGLEMMKQKGSGFIPP